ncbi:MAG: PD40 domain-containing protein [Planctomycetes bacterium]|nr:PD40 domain-containing protein [Planctomycetota bacterium]
MVRIISRLTWPALACCVLLVLPAAAGLAAPFVESRNAQCVAFSPDGKLIATGVSGQANGQFPPRPHPRPRKSGVVVLWDIASGKLLHRMETFGDLTKLRFSPDGSKLAYSRLFKTDDGVALNEVRVWDVKTGRTLHTFDRCYGFAFAPAGKSIAVLSRSRCNLFDMTSWTRRGEVKPLGKSVSITFSPDGKQLAGIGRTGQAYFIRLCDVASGRELRKSTSFKQPFYTIVFSPDGQRIASGHAGGHVLVWNAADLKPSARFNALTGELQHPFFSPDGSMLAAGGQSKGDVVMWNLSTGKEVRRFTHKRGSFHTFSRRKADAIHRPESDPTRFAFSPDGESFLAGCHGSILRLISTGRDVRRFGD